MLHIKNFKILNIYTLHKCKKIVINDNCRDKLHNFFFNVSSKIYI